MVSRLVKLLCLITSFGSCGCADVVSERREIVVSSEHEEQTDLPKSRIYQAILSLLETAPVTGKENIPNRNVLQALVFKGATKHDTRVYVALLSDTEVWIEIEDAETAGNPQYYGPCRIDDPGFQNILRQF